LHNDVLRASSVGTSEVASLCRRLLPNVPAEQFAARFCSQILLPMSVEHLHDINEFRHVAEHLKLALAAGQLGDWSWDAQSDIVTFGARGAKVLGLESQRTITWTELQQLIHEEDRERARIAVDNSLAERVDYNVEYRIHRNGELAWVAAQGRGVYAPGGETLGMIGVVSDITARREAEQARYRLAAIIESSDDAIISKTLQGIITTWNKGAERTFGYTAQEAIGRPILMLIPEDRRNEEKVILDKIRQGERVEHFETERVRKDGARINISVTISPIKDSRGQVIGASKIARDITEGIRAKEVLRESETRLLDEIRRAADEREQLLEAERAARTHAERMNLLKDEFLATLSHELRTPLNAILGWAQVLSMDEPPNDDFRQGLEAIERNARTQTQLIADLLDMSRIVAGKIRLDVQWTELASVVEAAVESVRPSAEAKGIGLRKILDPAAGPVAGDPTRLQQVVWNLLSNAIKFTPKGGKVDVLLQRVNSHLEITIHDTGIGIKPEFLPNVFERFRQGDASTTRSYGGLGLGLSIVKSLVELHGGTVRAKSEGEGCGATFTVALPLAPLRDGGMREHPGTAKYPAIDCDTVRLSGVIVLVVDDESDARTLISRVLEQCEATVFAAASAAEGLELLTRHKPHVLVSDIGMPTVDGYQFLRQVRQLPKEAGGGTPAIALTAFARSEDRTRAMMAGYQVHISKPIEAQELLATVGSLAGRTGGS
jgi:PAS domain S-box-containing protein